MIAGVQQWMKNFSLLGTIIHGMLFNVQLMLKSLLVIDRNKARLVVLGNKQEYGVNYEETFALIAKMTTVRMLIAIIASKGWPLP